MAVAAGLFATVPLMAIWVTTETKRVGEGVVLRDVFEVGDGAEFVIEIDRTLVCP
jgi:hypothetical protein